MADTVEQIEDINKNLERYERIKQSQLKYRRSQKGQESAKAYHKKYYAENRERIINRMRETRTKKKLEKNEVITPTE